MIRLTRGDARGAGTGLPGLVVRTERRAGRKPEADDQLAGAVGAIDVRDDEIVVPHGEIADTSDEIVVPRDEITAGGGEIVVTDHEFAAPGDEFTSACDEITARGGEIVVRSGDFPVAVHSPLDDSRDIGDSCARRKTVTKKSTLLTAVRARVPGASFVYLYGR